MKAIPGIGTNAFVTVTSDDFEGGLDEWYDFLRELGITEEKLGWVDELKMNVKEVEVLQYEDPDA